jgi:hypothetical protein
MNRMLVSKLSPLQRLCFCSSRCTPQLSNILVLMTETSVVFIDLPDHNIELYADGAKLEPVWVTSEGKCSKLDY